MAMLNDGQGDLHRRPYLYLRHGPNLSLVASETPYSYVEFYVESIVAQMAHDFQRVK